VSPVSDRILVVVFILEEVIEAVMLLFLFRFYYKCWDYTVNLLHNLFMLSAQLVIRA